MNKHNVRLLSLAASLVIAILVLTGCGGSKSSSADGKPAKITVFQSKVEITDALKSLAKDYQKETGQKVEIWATTGDDYRTQVKTKLSNRNSSPNIFSTGGGAESDMLKSYMADLSSQAFVKNIVPGRALKYNGKVYGLPYSVEGYGLIYNTALVKPAQIKSTKDFIAYLKDAKTQGKYTGFELSQETYFLIAHMLNNAFAVQKDPTAFLKQVESGKVQLQNVEAFKELGQIYEAIRDYTKNPMSVKYDDQIGDLMTGKTAMVNQGSWINTMLKDYKSSDVKLDMMAFPLDGNDRLNVSVPLWWNVNKDKPANEVKASEKFLNWLVSSKTGKDYIVNKFKFIPVMKNIKIDENKMDSLSLAIYKASQSGHTMDASTSAWPPGAIDTSFAPLTQKFFTDKSMTGQDLMKQISAGFVSTAKAK
ncbi:ABC transporter substrate-binding protein [Schleiferilactobacillus harbinensis]|uniref:ABC transporter substrate-binding protein n=1 Tax=Schleiferilactobacillus harbinensis TaxID=304207 RepID=UPI0021A66D6A|nr:ABC transporter substrate-binding protein [Schleiferilactobacillus harbinensis]